MSSIWIVTIKTWNKIETLKGYVVKKTIFLYKYASNKYIFKSIKVH